MTTAAVVEADVEAEPIVEAADGRSIGSAAATEPEPAESEPADPAAATVTDIVTDPAPTSDATSENTVRIPRPRPADSDPAATTPRPKTSLGTAAVIALSTLTFAALGYQRRWMADDGMIAVRTARQIVAGNGPVYSPFERAETNTSTLWTWMLALGGRLSSIDIARIAVFGGLLCAVAGVALALVATNRFHLRLAAPRGSTSRSGILLPAGILVLLGVSPFWDYATSGLESGLCTLWIGACWYVLVAWCANGPRTSTQYTAAVLFGLSPLVRPEFALLGAVFGVATWLLIRPGARRTLGLVAAAVALPAVYEVFRAGYYGTLVPLPALTKSATSSRWSRGFDYLSEFVIGYILWVPLAILVATLAVYAVRSVKFRTERILLATPVIAGLLLGLYVVNVGGDFMHARMMLPVTFLILLPVLLLPAVKLRLALPVATAVAVWAAVVAAYYPVTWVDQAHAVSEDERLGYQQYTGKTNPDTSAPYTEREAALTRALIAWKSQGVKMLTSEGGVTIPLDPALDFDAAVVAGRLGAAGAGTPLDDTVVDTLGLSYPLGARITPNFPGRPGHEKVLPWAWILADYGDPAVVDHKVVVDGVKPEDVVSARHALSCGALKELVDSTRRPMTPGRFWDNLTGSVGRTTLVVPYDPVQAERKFCG
jgi:arabinofuranosyltransferase